MIFTRYDLATGKILGTISFPDWALDGQVPPDGQGYIEGAHSPITKYVDVTSEIHVVADIETSQVKIADEAIKRINTETRNKIVSRYNEDKQRNMLAEWNELIMNGQQDSVRAGELLSAWNWIKSVRALSNTATASVRAAQSMQSVSSIEQAFYSDLSLI